MSVLDRLTRSWWRLTGRTIDLAGSERWLRAPMHREASIGDSWLAESAATLGATVRDGDPDAGLLADMSCLNGSTFDAVNLRPQVRDFYEHTSAWQMEVWAQWNPVFQPGGELIARFFGRRVQQLAIPTRPLDVAMGMDSRVVPVVDSAGEQLAAAWIRTLRSSGDHVYSGYYTTLSLPGSGQPSVHVTFPLEQGNVQVFLRPSAHVDGSLLLSSPPGPFGADGAYVTVERAGRHHAVRVPLHETFRVYVDDRGVLRTDHVLRLWSATVVRLHYKMIRSTRP